MHFFGAAATAVLIILLNHFLIMDLCYSKLVVLVIIT